MRDWKVFFLVALVVWIAVWLALLVFVFEGLYVWVAICLAAAAPVGAIAGFFARFHRPHLGRMVLAFLAPMVPFYVYIFHSFLFRQSQVPPPGGWPTETIRCLFVSIYSNRFFVPAIFFVYFAGWALTRLQNRRPLLVFAVLVSLVTAPPILTAMGQRFIRIGGSHVVFSDVRVEWTDGARWSVSGRLSLSRGGKYRMDAHAYPVDKIPKGLIAVGLGWKDIRVKKSGAAQEFPLNDLVPLEPGDYEFQITGSSHDETIAGKLEGLPIFKPSSYELQLRLHRSESDWREVQVYRVFRAKLPPLS